jgi:peptidyl-tRNA hydrolase, PTH1 family
MKLIVGLGNPGEKYAGNRHNIGFMAVDEMARGYSFGPWKKRFQGLTAEGQIGLERCILLKPSTYMNESGRAVGEAMRFYKIPLADVIVIHDEIDLKPGAIRMKTGGGNAGHNGLRSVSAHIGNDYRRVRLGVDHPGDKAVVANYVLQDFSKSDQAWLIPLLEGVARGMAKLVEGSEAAFLSEAARGRKPSAPAAKLNGATPPAPEAAVVEEPGHAAEALKPTQAETQEPAPEAAEIAAPEPEAHELEAPAPVLQQTAAIEGLSHVEAEALAAIVAAASKPIEPMPAPAVAVAPVAELAPLFARKPKPAPVAEPVEAAIAEAETETVIEARSEVEIVPPATAVGAIVAPEPAPHAAHAESVQTPEAVAISDPAPAEEAEALETEPTPEAEPELHPARVETVIEPELIPPAVAVIEPEAVPHPAAVEAVAAKPAPEPVAQPDLAMPPKLEMPPATEPAQPAPAAEPVAQHAVTPESTAAPQPEAKKAEAFKVASAKPQAAPTAKKKEGFFSWWFRTRVRGGGYH